MQEAINEIKGIVNYYPFIKEIVINPNEIVVKWTDPNVKEKSFKNAIELLEWCDEKLKPSYLNGYEKQFCYHCKKDRTPEGHDGCVGTLKGVMNSCCGHGDTAVAYVQFNHKDYLKEPNKKRIDGQEAIDYIKKNREAEN